MKTYILIVTFFTMFNTFASEGVAKVIIAKGTVTDLQTNKQLKKNDWVQEGAKIQTDTRSFVKLIFIDKSNMSLGPNSQIVVAKFKKDEAGIITLLKGQLRSKVTKNYMDMTDKEKSKLFIKTRTAAMGVRGTDFQVNYNPENMNTSLVTFEGAVAMGAINDLTSKIMDQRKLETIVSDPTAVMVTKGLFSGVMPDVDSKPVSPVKINTNQLKALESNDGSGFDKKTTSTKPTAVPKRNILPPAVDGKDFQGDNTGAMIKEFAKVDKTTADKMKKDFGGTDSKVESKRENLTNNAQFTDGGLINTEVVAYIAPPKNSAIDPLTKNPIMPVNLGGFDPKTGEYKNEFFKLNNKMQWVENVVPTDSKNRQPASAASKPLMPETPMNATANCNNCAPPIIGNVKPPINTDNFTKDSYDKINNIVNDVQKPTKSRVKFQAQ